tara:strand:+ start:1424 stop:2944 length:1521 start_codon:yes stop_codon:yes gene_type:complete
MSGFLGKDENPFNMSNDMKPKERAERADELSRKGYAEKCAREKTARQEKYIWNQITKPTTLQEYYDANKYLKNKPNVIKRIKGDLGDDEYHSRGPNKFRRPKEIYSPTDEEAEQKFKEMKDIVDLPEHEVEKLRQEDIMNKYKSNDNDNDNDDYYGYDSDNYDSDEQRYINDMIEKDNAEALQEQKDLEDYMKKCAEQDECKRIKGELEKLHTNERRNIDPFSVRGSNDGSNSECAKRKRMDRFRKAHRAKTANQDIKDSIEASEDMSIKDQQKLLIPALNLGDDLDMTNNPVIIVKKGHTNNNLSPDWGIIWQHSEDSWAERMKYYNPTFKLETNDNEGEKPLQNKPQFSNEYIRKNLKDAYNESDNAGKIIVWNPVREQGMVDIYEKLVDNTENDTPIIKMGWDNSKGNDRPYYVIGDVPTYKPPMNLLSSFSYNITSTDGVYTNEKEPAGGPKAKGGKRKTQKKKQPKQKRAGSTKKTKKAKKGGKTSQKKGKQQKRGTRGKK